MSTEPERDIEKTLKAYAAKRREQAGAPLHMPGHTRALLQRETRQVGRDVSGPPLWLRFLGALWFRPLWFRLGVPAALAAAAVLFWSPWRDHPMQLAKEKSPPGAEYSLGQTAAYKKTTSEMAAPPLAPPAPASALASDSLPVLSKDAKSAAAGPATASVPPVVAPAPSGALSDLSVTRGVAPAYPPASLPLAAAPQLARGEFDLTKAKSTDRSQTAKNEGENPPTTENAMRSRSFAPPAPSTVGVGGQVSGERLKAEAGGRMESRVDAPTGNATASANGPAGGRGGGVFGGVTAASAAPPSSVSGKPPTTPLADFAKTNSAFRANANLTIVPPPVTESPASESVLWQPAYAPPPEPVNLRGFTAAALGEGSAIQEFSQAPAPVPANRAAQTANLQKVPMARQVLQSFRMEQSGEDLRVIDADGSVYVGGITRRDPSNTKDRAAARLVLPGDAARIETGKQAYFFRVEGTNETVHAIVRFSGDIVPAPEPAPAKIQGRAAAAAPGLQNVVSTPFTLSRTQVSGRVRVGEAPEVPIKAFPVAK